MLLCLQMFDLTVKYKKGSEMYIADMLSRAALPETGPCRGSLNAKQEEVCMVNIEEVNSTEFSRISEDGMKSMQAVTNRDDQLQILKQVIPLLTPCNDQSTNRHSHARHLIRSTFILKNLQTFIESYNPKCTYNYVPTHYKLVQ